jgi:hypothetical protein
MEPTSLLELLIHRCALALRNKDHCNRFRQTFHTEYAVVATPAQFCWYAPLVLLASLLLHCADAWIRVLNRFKEHSLKPG